MRIEDILADIQSKHRPGCGSERQNQALKNRHFYEGRFDKHWDRVAEEDMAPRRPCLLAQYVINQICNVNKEQPNRDIHGHPKETALLQKWHNDNKTYAKLLAAERLSCISEVACLQVCSTGNKDKPVKIHVWDASQFDIYQDPDDPTEAIAVVLRDRMGSLDRYQIWTKDEYQIAKVGKNKNNIPEWESKGFTSAPEANPYGILPFVFIPWNTPTLSFWAGSPGDNLTAINDYANRRLSKMGAAQEYLCEPITVVSGAGPNFLPPRSSPGKWINVNAANIGDMEGTTKVEISHLQPDYNFSSSGWDDIMQSIDLTLELNGIPLSATRMVQSTGRSGVSIQMEQWPLAVARSNRQNQWRDIEQQLAVVMFKVAGSSAKISGSPSNQYGYLYNFADTMNLSVTYPEVFIEVPGPERDRANEFELQVGLKSKIQLYMERNKCTREEAIAHLRQVAEDNEIEATWTKEKPDELSLDVQQDQSLPTEDNSTLEEVQ